jgi:hypothetical protein
LGKNLGRRTEILHGAADEVEDVRDSLESLESLC